MKSGIYFITNTANGSGYIGSSNNITGRWRDHKRALRKGIHDNQHLQNAWNKYGEEAFTFSVLEYCEVDVLLQREQHYLDLHWGIDIYNINPIANKPPCQVGRSLSQEQIEMVRSRLKARWSIPDNVTNQRNMMVGNSYCKGRIRPKSECIQIAKAKGNKYSLITITNGSTSLEFELVKEVAEHLNCTTRNVYDMLYGKQRTCKGWWLV